MKIKLSAVQKMKSKKLVVFDLDGTLAPSKSVIDAEMRELLLQLLVQKKVAVVGGGKYALFKEQLVRPLRAKAQVAKHLFLFPTTSTAFYRYNEGWKKVYSHELSKTEVKKIKETFEKVFVEIGYKHPKKTYGELIENRGTQVSFSVYGQDIVKVLGKRGVKMKEQWKEKHTPTKMKIAERVATYLPEFEVRAAGFTTIDVTKKGIDKAYGLTQIQKYVKVPIADMVFVGDSIMPGGNDYAVVRTGVDYVAIADPEETKQVIRGLLA